MIQFIIFSAPTRAQFKASYEAIEGRVAMTLELQEYKPDIELQMQKILARNGISVVSARNQIYNYLTSKYKWRGWFVSTYAYQTSRDEQFSFDPSFYKASYGSRGAVAISFPIGLDKKKVLALDSATQNAINGFQCGANQYTAASSILNNLKGAIGSTCSQCKIGAAWDKLIEIGCFVGICWDPINSKREENNEVTYSSHPNVQVMTKKNCGKKPKKNKGYFYQYFVLPPTYEATVPENE